ncbi:MAG TPA: Hsp20/alpha crystallin family protein [Planctomycetota bacterium]|nr:Hsp20/alpha crystallin family protein [Planctomycetota bacterium]
MEQTPEGKGLARPDTRMMSRPEQIRQAPHIHPPVDILDRTEEILLRADMPGIPPDGIDVRFENGVLILSGKAPEGPADMKDDVFREFERVDYYREFSIGEGVDEDKISADYDSGVLTLHLPKSEARQSRRIEIQRK